MGVSWALPADLVARDEELTGTIDLALSVGAARASAHLTCRVGCTECCIGPFDISPLDAARLRRGLAELRAEQPRIADAVTMRAREQWNILRHEFPGDRERAVLAEDDGARSRFFSRFAELPCPALERESGACLLYDYRPISCRTFGLPIRFGDEVMPPCRLNFRDASEADVDAATVAPDPSDEEGKLLSRVQRDAPDAGDTIIAAVTGLGSE